ncbi:MAG: hypothetical protein GZ094_20165 [Mariniphaga sp.]|nr:hypothetical protein [Mariniphaga sp.]
MTNDIIHIALHVSEKDVHSFYVHVLNGKVIRTFELSKVDASEIFNINKKVKVSKISCEGIDFELFVDNDLNMPTFAHVSFQSLQAKEIFEKAKLKGYRTYVRNNNSSVSYFISDTNCNLFEIKTKERWYITKQ